MTSYASSHDCPACSHDGTEVIRDPDANGGLWHFVCWRCRHEWDGPWDPSTAVLVSDSRF